MAICRPCTPFSATLTGVSAAASADQCLCLPGFYLKPDNTCSPVPPGFFSDTPGPTYKPCPNGTISQSYGATVCSACPPNSIRVDPMSCTCAAGYVGTLVDGWRGTCVACNAGFYRSANDSRCVACPLNSRGPIASKSLPECKCDYGFYKVAPKRSGDPFTCAACSVGARCPGDNNMYALQGYWRSSPNSTVFLTCPPDFCLDEPTLAPPPSATAYATGRRRLLFVDQETGGAIFQGSDGALLRVYPPRGAAGAALQLAGRRALREGAAAGGARLLAQFPPPLPPPPPPAPLPGAFAFANGSFANGTGVNVNGSAPLLIDISGNGTNATGAGNGNGNGTAVLSGNSTTTASDNSTAGAVRKGALCREGHTGTLCSECLKGWSMHNRFCERCGEGDDFAKWALWRKVVMFGLFVIGSSIIVALFLLPVLPRLEAYLKGKLGVLTEWAVRQASRLVRFIARIAQRFSKPKDEASGAVTRKLQRSRTMDEAEVKLQEVTQAFQKNVLVPFRIFVDLLQIVTSFSTVLSVPWPSTFEIIVGQVGTAVNLEASRLPTVSCVRPDPSFYTIFKAYTLLPLGLIAVFLVAYLAAWFVLLERRRIASTPVGRRVSRAVRAVSRASRRAVTGAWATGIDPVEQDEIDEEAEQAEFDARTEVVREQVVALRRRFTRVALSTLYLTYCAVSQKARASSCGVLQLL